MKAFALASLLPLVASIPSHPAPSPYGYGHPEPYHQPYAYAPAPSYHHAPAYPQPNYGYEHPKHNCTVQDVTEIADICTPNFEAVCENVELTLKQIVDGEFCFEGSRTVCSESTQEIENEICSYTYQKKYEEAVAKTVDVSFIKETNVQMVTVCQPGYGHGYHSYGHQYCKEVAQETAYNVPVVTPVDVDVRVSYPEPIKTCVNKPITLPVISCETITESKCMPQPQVEEITENVEKCVTQLTEPSCQQVELTLPKQVCVELVYGYAHDPEPKYPEPKYPEPPKYPEHPVPSYPPSPSHATPTASA